MKPVELYFAIIAGVEAADLSTWDRNEINSFDIDRFILNSSKGLAEITESAAPKVQFIHESVNDFLLKENGLGRIWPDLETNFRGQSHERLKQCCSNYINFDEVHDRLELCENLQKASSNDDKALRKQISEELPFLEYAVQHILHHTNIAESLQIRQGKFIQNLQLPNLVRLDNLFESKQVRRHTEGVSLLYILAEHDWANLVQHCPSVSSSLEPEHNERYGLPLFAALATKSDSVLTVFRKIYADAARQNGSYAKWEKYHSIGVSIDGKRDFKFSRDIPILVQLMDFDIDIMPRVVLSSGMIEVNSKDKKGRTPLLWATIEGNEAAVELLLETGQVEIDLKGEIGRTPLWWAAYKGDEVIVRLLLETGQVERDLKDEIGQTPLWWAAMKGNEAAFKLLLETGQVRIDLKHEIRQKPLYWSVYEGNESAVKLLLETGQVKKDLKDKIGGTPLWWAAYEGNKAAVKLLETGQVEIDLQNKTAGTLLRWAVYKANEALVELLLETGQIERDLKDEIGRTPLYWVIVYKGNQAVVKLLLETGQAKMIGGYWLTETRQLYDYYLRQVK